MRRWSTVIIVATLALLLSAAVPIPALGTSEVIHVSGTEVPVGFDDVLVRVSHGCAVFDTTGTTRLECDSPLLTGYSHQIQDWVYVFRPDMARFHGSFTIMLDAGGEWRGNYHGGYTGGVWWGEFVGRGYGGAVDGGMLYESIYGGVIDAEIRLAD